MTEQSGTGAIRLYLRPEDYNKVIRVGSCRVQSGTDSLVVVNSKFLVMLFRSLRNGDDSDDPKMYSKAVEFLRWADCDLYIPDTGIPETVNSSRQV